MSEPPAKFHWSEKRIARFATMLVSGLVVVADLVLVVVFVRMSPSLPGGWRAHWYIPMGIAFVFLFALRRFLKYWTLFKADQ
jgi:hypothetical protein